MWFDVKGDFRTAFRSVRRNPGTSLLIVVTLAMAIGAATIGFAFADLALFRGLPVDDNSRVVSVFASDTHGSNPRARISATELLEYRNRSTTLEHLAGLRDGLVPLIRNGQSQTLMTGYATANLFAAMGQQPLLGRAFIEGDDRRGAPPVVLLAHHYWRDMMDSRPDAIGRTLQLGRELFTVVGVLRPDFEFGSLAEVDVWLPMVIDPDGPRDARNVTFIARLKAGVPFEQAAAEMAAIGQSLATEHPSTNGGWSLRLIPIRDRTGGEGFWVVIALFFLSMGLLILIATANVSNLIMVRAAARARELAVRTAMGARGGRLLRQFLVEGLTLSVAGAALAVPAAWAGLKAIGAYSPEPVFQQLIIDWHELSFVASLALICPVVFSLASARLITTPDLRGVLAAQGGRGTTAAMRSRSTLVVAQLALAVILLTASTLAMRSITHAFSQPLGMAIDRLAAFDMDFNDATYPEAAAASTAQEAMRLALSETPGVSRVAVLSSLPVLGDRGRKNIVVDGQVVPAGEATPTAVITGARADAVDILGVPLQAGRWWAEGEEGNAVISLAAATRFFGGAERALGRTLSFDDGGAAVSYRVSGVSADVANTSRIDGAPPRVWVPLSRQARRVTFVIESREPAAAASQVRTVAATTNPAVPVERLNTLREAFRLAEASDYATIGTLGGFSIVALILAALGLFGVISYSVSQRTPEFGTRIALGATAGAVVGLVARQAIKLLAIGLVIGLLGGVGVGFLMRGMLFGVSPADPVTVLGIVLLLGAISLIATALPAWRASRIDPLVALRAD